MTCLNTNDAADKLLTLRETNRLILLTDVVKDPGVAHAELRDYLEILPMRDQRRYSSGLKQQRIHVLYGKEEH